MADSIALRTEHLSKQFSRGRLAVDDLSLSVEAGEIYGFLGPNGAGKTTTIRMLLDLVRPTRGTVSLFGSDPRKDRSVLRRVGALAEGAAFYPFLTGRANLTLLSRISSGVAQPIDDLLAQVGLFESAQDRFRTYSTGMKQRLGIAAALLNNPDLVILDEPTNGLDPLGMVEIRELIRNLAARDGKTVFLSSHQLTEIEQVCDRVAIIDKGRLVLEGHIADLLDTSGGTVHIEVDNPPAALAALDGQWRAVAANGIVEVGAMRSEIPAVIATLVAQQIAIYAVTPQRQSLESLFLTLVDKPND